MDRRAFLSTSLMTAAAMKALPLQAATVAPAAVAPPPIIGAARFRALIGQQFQVVDGRRTLGDVQLTAVDAGPETASLEQFSVRFRAPEAPVPGVYALHHPSTGPIAMRLESSQDDAERVAVFSLLLNSEGRHV